ncbi:hypothetical protein FHG87_020859 [Trinorchestia longiramus]|nr:hypothetical protein FHG87_020859 [Trinorchestia longiramus]
MHARLSEKRPALVNRRGPILLYDNARPHVARMTVQKLTELGYETLPHPPYSPDLSPTNYHLFKHLSTFLDGKLLGLNKRRETRAVLSEQPPYGRPPNTRRYEHSTRGSGGPDLREQRPVRGPDKFTPPHARTSPHKPAPSRGPGTVGPPTTLRGRFVSPDHAILQADTPFPLEKRSLSSWDENHSLRDVASSFNNDISLYRSPALELSPC